MSPFKVAPSEFTAAKGKKKKWTCKELDALFFENSSCAPGPEDHIALAFFVQSRSLADFNKLAKIIAQVYGSRASVAGGLAVADVYFGYAGNIEHLKKGMVGLAMTGPRMRATTSLYSRTRALNMHGVARRLINTEVRFGYLFSCVGRVDEDEMKSFATRFGKSSVVGFFGQGEIAPVTFEDVDEEHDAADAGGDIAPADVSGYCLAILAVGLPAEQ